MTVASATNRARYDGDGTSTVFAVPFYFLEAGDLKLVRSDTDGSETVLTPGIDYSVLGAGDPAGGSVTLTVAPSASQEIVILRDIAPTQGTDFEENADLPAETLERGFDRLTMLIQQIVEQVARSMLLPTATSLTNIAFPAPEPGKLVAGNDAGDGFVNKTPAGTGQVVFPVGVAEGGTGAATAAAARTNLGAEAADPEILKADTADTLSAGYTLATHDLGNSGTGTVTPDFADGNAQQLAVTGSCTLAAPAGAGVMRLELTNDATGGHSVTLSGFDLVMGGVYEPAASAVQQVEIDTTGTKKIIGFSLAGVAA